METENKTVRPTYLKKNGGRRADMKHPRPALKTLASSTSNGKQTTQPRVVGDEKSRVVLDECFTPRRSLCRSPPPNKKPDHTGSITPVFRVQPRTGHAATSVPVPSFKTALHAQSSSDKATAAVPLDVETNLLDTVPPQSRRELPRTPLCKQKNSISIRDVQSKGKSSSNTEQSRRKECENSPPHNIAAGQKAAPANLGGYKQVPPGKPPQGTDAKEKAVTGCFTPSHSLRRSPPVKLGRKEYPAISVSGEAPLQTNFELPRTPYMKIKQSAMQSEATTHPSLPQHETNFELPRTPCMKINQSAMQSEATMHPSLPQHETNFELPRTPCLKINQTTMHPSLPQHETNFELPRTPYVKINQSAMQSEAATHPSLPQHDTTDVSQSACTVGEQTQMVTHETAQLGTLNAEVQNTEVKTTAMQTDICPVAVSFLNPTAPRGLDCDENDVLFLRKIKNVRQYRHLETQVTHLDKGIKDATAQKELLEFEAQKVKQDLVDMRTKYYETVASIQALISNPVSVSTSEAVQTATEHATITQVHLKKLRQLQQTMGVVSEKVDKELKLKATEIEVTKEKLCSQIKEEKQIVEEKVKERHCVVQCSETEKVEWQNKLKELQNCRREMEEKLNQSRTLSAMQQHKDKQNFLEEKGRAENRLRQIIKRCEMCVQRHKLLKEMKAVP
eukprot:Em0023g561a